MPYIELHTHSHYSLLDGASAVPDLVARAAEFGMPALALTDHDAVYGIPAFIRAAREHNIQPILGAELTTDEPVISNRSPITDHRGEAGAAQRTAPIPNTGHHLTLLVTDQAGWHNLCYLISRARHAAPKGEAALPPDELVGCTDGLIGLSGCRHGEIPAALLRGDRNRALAAARRYRDLFGRDRFWIELQRHYTRDDDWLVRQLTNLAAELELGCVATNNVHYARRDGHRLQDVLVCIRHNTTLDASTHLRRPNSEYYLKSPAQMAALFADHPTALAATLHLAERCQFTLDYGLQDLPHYETPHGMSDGAYLRRLCEEALPLRYPDAPERARRQLNHELDVITRAGLANYFLIVWDIIRFARSRSIRCQGRGSAANSIVAYLLYISPVDPLANDLVFGRFLSEERQVIPDIDLDFDAARREEVIQYVYDEYGPEHTAMACTFFTYQARSAARDIAKALNLSPEVAATAVAELTTDHGSRLTTHGSRLTNPPLHLLLDLCHQIHNFPRHLGIHSGGMVVTGAPLMGRVPTEPATMADRTVVQWDKDGLEEVGLVKIDLLGLRMLSAISEAAALVETITGQPLDLDNLTFGPDSSKDPAVYEMIAAADTVGVFQVESAAQRQLLPRLRPARFEDLIITISLIRPGPIQGEMVHPYLRRRLGLEPVTYPHPALKAALEETLGVILFQEQVLKVARDLAGFSEGQGELLRRALGAKQAYEEIQRLHDDFLAGAAERGVPAAIAEDVFDRLKAFGGFSFAKSHAAAFAVLVYQSAWLKRYHFAPFFVALLNNQPMGFWNPAVLVHEARRHEIPVLPVDIHISQARCTVEGPAIRLGFNYVKTLGQEHIDRIVRCRAGAPFADLEDFCRRTRLPRRAVEQLIQAGAMDTWEIPRRQLLWQLGRLRYHADELDLAYQPDPVPLPPLSLTGAMAMEQNVLGLNTGEQIMSFYRPRLRRQNILNSLQLAACPDGKRVRIAGLLVVHQSPPTAKGHHFLTLEDEEGMLSVILRPRTYARYRHILHATRLLLIAGTVQQQDGVTSVLGSGVAALDSAEQLT